MQYRHGGMDTFFKHDNHKYPPSLSERGRLWQRKKSDLIDIVEWSSLVHLMSSWLMVLPWYTSSQLLVLLHLTIFHSFSPTHYKIITARHRQKWTLSGTTTWLTAWNWRNEIRAYRERWQARPRSQAIGLTSSVTRQRSRNSSGSCQKRCLCRIWSHRSPHWQWPLHVSLWSRRGRYNYCGLPARCSREWMHHMAGVHCECWCCRHRHWQVHFLGD